MQKDKLHVALVGSAGTLGREVKTFLEEREFPVRKINLLDSPRYEGVISEFKGEAHLIAQADADSFLHSDIIFFCCTRDEGIRYSSFSRKKGSIIIDLSMACRERGSVPTIDCDMNVKDLTEKHEIISAPHPISMLLTHMLQPLDAAFGIELVSAHVFQPVSDFGEEGIEELSQQTINILNFGKIPKMVFGRQLAFNIIPSFMLPHAQGNKKADVALGMQVSEILDWQPGKLALRLFLVPVFYCHSFSIHVIFKKRPPASEMLDQLKKIQHVRISFQELQGATPVETAGSSEIVTAALAEDGLTQGGFWLWLVTDNLISRAALNAVKIAEAFIGSDDTLGARRRELPT